MSQLKALRKKILLRPEIGNVRINIEVIVMDADVQWVKWILRKRNAVH